MPPHHQTALVLLTVAALLTTSACRSVTRDGDALCTTAQQVEADPAIAWSDKWATTLTRWSDLDTLTDDTRTLLGAVEGAPPPSRFAQLKAGLSEGRAEPWSCPTADTLHFRATATLPTAAGPAATITTSPTSPPLIRVTTEAVWIGDAQLKKERAEVLAKLQEEVDRRKQAASLQKRPFEGPIQLAIAPDVPAATAAMIWGVVARVGLREAAFLGSAPKDAPHPGRLVALPVLLKEPKGAAPVLVEPRGVHLKGGAAMLSLQEIAMAFHGLKADGTDAVLIRVKGPVSFQALLQAIEAASHMLPEGSFAGRGAWKGAWANRGGEPLLTVALKP